MGEKMKLILVIFLFLTSFAVYSENSNSLFEKAEKLFANRSQDYLLDDVMLLLEEALKTTTDNKLKYKIYILYSNCLLWKGNHIKDVKQRILIYEKGRKISQLAIELYPEFADAYYLDACHHIRWGEFQSLSTKAMHLVLLHRTLNKIKQLDTSDFEPGETYAGYGADRILGAIYLRAPVALGGDVNKAVITLKKAYENAKNHSTNIIFYAEALIVTGETQKAKGLLTNLLQEDPETFNPIRIPETKDDMKEAKKLLEKIR